MAMLEAVVTNKAKELWLKMFGTVAGGQGLDTPFAPILRFKVGEGGFKYEGPNKVPKDPDPTLEDLEAVADPGLAFFVKELLHGDFSFEFPALLKVNCLLDFGEFNGTEIFEVGLFSEINGTEFMVAYGTLNKLDKTDDRQILIEVSVKS